jgi:hypothetical protein
MQKWEYCYLYNVSFGDSIRSFEPKLIFFEDSGVLKFDIFEILRQYRKNEMALLKSLKDKIPSLKITESSKNDWDNFITSIIYFLGTEGWELFQYSGSCCFFRKQI